MYDLIVLKSYKSGSGLNQTLMNQNGTPGFPSQHFENLKLKHFFLYFSKNGITHLHIPANWVSDSSCKHKN